MMKMNHSVFHACFAALICLGVVSSTPALADHIFVQSATGSGVSSADLATATELIKTAVVEVSSHEVVPTPEQADFFLRPTLLKLGAAYVLSLSKADKTGRNLFSTQLKAEKIDELDKVALRVTRSALSGAKASQDEHVGEITNQEENDGTQRRPTRKEWYLGFGPMTFSNLNTTGIGYSLGVARAWDVNTVLIKIMGEAGGHNSAFLISLGIGGEYFLSTGNTAPYVGADFGFGAAKASGNAGFFTGSVIGGFDGGLQAGVELLRSSKINLDVNFRAGFLLKSNSYGLPSVYSLRLGLYF